MTTFALPFSVSLSASRSCRQRNGGLLSSFHGFRWSYTWPYKDLEEERISYTVQTHTHSLSHTTFIRPGPQQPQKAGVYIQGPQTVCILMVSECVYCTGASRVAECPVTPMDYRGIIHTLSLTLIHTHKSTLKNNNSVCEPFFTYRVYLVKHFVRP